MNTLKISAMKLQECAARRQVEKPLKLTGFYNLIMRPFISGFLIPNLIH